MPRCPGPEENLGQQGASIVDKEVLRGREGFVHGVDGPVDPVPGVGLDYRHAYESKVEDREGVVDEPVDETTAGEGAEEGEYLGCGGCRFVGVVEHGEWIRE